MADIILAVDEPIDATQCGGKENCHDDQKCITHDLWAKLNDHILDYLRAVTLKQMVDGAEREGVRRRPGAGHARDDRRSATGRRSRPEPREEIDSWRSHSLKARQSRSGPSSRKRGKGLGLRVGVKKVGCSGFAYTFDFADEVRAGDALFEAHDANVVVDADSLPFLDGARARLRQGRAEADVQVRKPERRQHLRLRRELQREGNEPGLDAETTRSDFRRPRRSKP